MSSAASRKVTIHQGDLLWCGEHWINYLRDPGAQQNSAMVSLFHTRHSPAGEGNVAYVHIAGGLDAICTDSPELAAYLHETITRGRKGPFDRDMPTVRTRFSRAGDIRTSPAWILETERVRATWSRLGPPIIADGSFREGTEHFTVLIFAEQASIQVDGQPCSGVPYRVDVWKPSIGEQRSSCVFALAETFIRLPTW
jgi:hypothetical protein